MLRRTYSLFFNHRGSIGVQLKSNGVTKTCFSIGKERRDIKPGIFKRDIDGIVTKISIPKF